MKRRTFIKTLFGAIVAIPLAQLPRMAFAAGALPEGKKAVSESDPVASAIGYKEDGKKADVAKFPQAKGKAGKDQICGNCALYTKVNDNWGNCQMLTSGVVAHGGWCGSWSKKS